MIREMLLTFDSDMISNQQKDQILLNNNNISEVTNGLYLFRFDDVRFLHVLRLLKPETFGYDVSEYLQAVIFKLSRMKNQTFIRLDMGSPDFKRRSSEEFGVVMAALFMADSFNLDWSTITQIDEGTKTKKPDYIGYQIMTNNEYIFEAKGTTDYRKVDGYLKKALDQLNEYGGDKSSKYAVVSSFMNSKRVSPSHMIVADPPYIGKMKFTPMLARRMHYAKVLSSMDMPISSKYMMKSAIIKAKQLYNDRINTNQTKFLSNYYDMNHYESLEMQEEIKKNKEKMELINGRYTVIQERKIENENVKISFGVKSIILDRIIAGEDIDTRFNESTEGNISYLSDGTYMKVEI